MSQDQPLSGHLRAVPTSYGLKDYVREVEAILDRRPAMPVVIRKVSEITRKLCADGAWLSPSHRIGCPDSYTRHLLHRDRCNRFVVLSLVWQPGQATPIHDHDCWGVMGILDNRLEEVHYERLDDGSRADYAELRESGGVEVTEGSVGYVLPPYQEIHRIANTSEKESVSIHIYGRDLDAINVFDPVTRKKSLMRIRYYGSNCGGTEYVI